MDAEQLKKSRFGRLRRGLTLVELLVVLVILAVMTAIAVQSVGTFADQARYTATQQTLQNIQNAILGPASQIGANGSLPITGFVADMGRLPQPVYVGGVLAGDPLRELWDVLAIAANGATVNGIFTLNVPGDNSTRTTSLLKATPTTNFAVTLPSGWRGPYLQLSAGSSNLVDGWGNLFQSLYQPPGATAFTFPVPAGFPVNALRSLGADGLIDTFPITSPYNQDQYIPPQTSAPPPTPLANFSQLVYGTIFVNVQSINATTTPAALTNPFPSTPPETTPKVRVVLFAPVNGLMTTFVLDSTSSTTNPYNPSLTPATYLSATPYYTSTPNPTPMDFAITTTTPTTAVSGYFYNVPIGPRAIQAFQYDAATMVITKKSPLINLNVPAGNISATLILQ